METLPNYTIDSDELQTASVSFRGEPGCTDTRVEKDEIMTGCTALNYCVQYPTIQLQGRWNPEYLTSEET